jgi:hypothetical protein
VTAGEDGADAVAGEGGLQFSEQDAAPAIPASPATVTAAARLIQRSARLIRGSVVPPVTAADRVTSPP